MYPGWVWASVLVDGHGGGVVFHIAVDAELWTDLDRLGSGVLSDPVWRVLDRDAVEGTRARADQLFEVLVRAGGVDAAC